MKQLLTQVNCSTELNVTQAILLNLDAITHSHRSFLIKMLKFGVWIHRQVFIIQLLNFNCILVVFFRFVKLFGSFLVWFYYHCFRLICRCQLVTLHQIYCLDGLILWKRPFSGSWSLYHSHACVHTSSRVCCSGQKHYCSLLFSIERERKEKRSDNKCIYLFHSNAHQSEIQQYFLILSLSFVNSDTVTNTTHIISVNVVWMLRNANMRVYLGKCVVKFCNLFTQFLFNV